MRDGRRFFYGFLAGLFLFAAANLLAAHLLSDCGLPAVLGADSCADDVVRAGFPLVFLERGGFDSHSLFSRSMMFTDVLIGLGFAALCGLAISRALMPRKSVL